MSHNHLYHGSSSHFTTLNLTDWEQTKNGIKGLWAFATHLRSHALPYTFSGLSNGKARWRLMETVETSPDKGLTIVYTEHAQHFREPFEGYLHRLPRDPFTRVTGPNGPTNEWVSAKPVSLMDGQTEHISSFTQVMNEGIQLFSSTRRKSDEEMLRIFDKLGTREACHALVRSGDLTWENGLSNIGCAAEFYDLTLFGQSRQAHHKGPFL